MIAISILKQPLVLRNELLIQVKPCGGDTILRNKMFPARASGLQQGSMHGPLTNFYPTSSTFHLYIKNYLNSRDRFHILITTVQGGKKRCLGKYIAFDGF